MLSHQWLLSNPTLNLLEFHDAVEMFVLGWCSAVVEPVYGPATYTIRAKTRSKPVWTCPDCDHPLDALTAFVQVQPELLSQVRGIYARKLSDQGTSIHDVRLNKIVDWRRSFNPKDVEWYILAYGFARRKR